MSMLTDFGVLERQMSYIVLLVSSLVPHDGEDDEKQRDDLNESEQPISRSPGKRAVQV